MIVGREPLFALVLEDRSEAGLREEFGESVEGLASKVRNAENLRRPAEILGVPQVKVDEPADGLHVLILESSPYTSVEILVARKLFESSAGLDTFRHVEADNLPVVPADFRAGLRSRRLLRLLRLQCCQLRVELGGSFGEQFEQKVAVDGAHVGVRKSPSLCPVVGVPFVVASCFQKLHELGCLVELCRDGAPDGGVERLLAPVPFQDELEFGFDKRKLKLGAGHVV